jgi:hypothetical protein
MSCVPFSGPFSGPILGAVREVSHSTQLHITARFTKLPEFSRHCHLRGWEACGGGLVSEPEEM